MKKRGKSLSTEISIVAEKFLERISNKDLFVVSHFDTDGITSASIMIKTLKHLDKTFSLKIVKSLDESFISSLPKDKVILFLDLASGSLHHIEKLGLKDVFIIDHHEVVYNIPENVHIVNPELLEDKQKISSSCLTYLFCREISDNMEDLAKLALIGMIGDTLEKEIGKINHGILNDGKIKKRRGPLIYPSTRPLNKVLEFSSNPYIPGVTGNAEGVIELLRDAGIKPLNNRYKSLIELTEDEMSNLVTAIMLRNPLSKNKEIIGDIFLVSLFNKFEDAREISAIINACSRLGEPETAIQFCLELQGAKKKAESLYIKYKQLLLSSLKFVTETEKIEEEGFVIINARDNVKDTIVGTITSILANSSLYEDGTIITTMAIDDTKERIKVSSRSVGKVGRNVREVLSTAVEEIGGEVGGHEFAAGCLIPLEKEQEFIESLKKTLKIEFVKV